MKMNRDTPWHRESWDRFVADHLPQLLGERLPLSGYQSTAESAYTCRIEIALAGQEEDVVVEQQGVPQPDVDGIFELEDRRLVVHPIALQEELEQAEILCVGDQLHSFIEVRLGEAPKEIVWELALAASWLPLKAWICEFLRQHGSELVDQNWLSRHTHLRRLSVPERERVLTPAHFGRVCPIETPEGPNIGRILTVAQGAAIREGRLTPSDDSPTGMLGLSASAIPFLEHSESSRLLMGANMMRQWTPQTSPEPALVQTGSEPSTPSFWCGRNLLTGFISWDGDAFEDAVVISESAAARFCTPHPIEVGDKVSNRHGSKGVVSRILPDQQMPQLPDGTALDLIYSVCGLPSRLNFGVVLEALMGRIAKIAGKSAVVPPFQSPSEKEFRAQLAAAGLREDGLEVLTLGGTPLQRPSAAGWVYWGRTNHDVADKIHVCAGHGRPQRLGVTEHAALAHVDAHAVASELFNTCAADRIDAATLEDRVASGQVLPAAPPTPTFQILVDRLRASGIGTVLEGEALRLHFEAPTSPTLQLARPVAHPWCRQHQLRAVGVLDEVAEYEHLEQTNERLKRMIGSGGPEGLVATAAAQLESAVEEYLNALLTPAHLHPGARVLFSGRTVTVPGADLAHDQIGLPEEMCRKLFGPLLTRAGGDADDRALDELMSGSWVIAYRGVVLSPTASFVAFHPVRCAGRAIRLHPFACELLNSDFDGDQLAIFVPVTEAGQREAGEKLSVAALLKSNPELIHSLGPRMDARLGLASLSLTVAGRAEIDGLLRAKIESSGPFVTAGEITAALGVILEREGVEQALEASGCLMRRGFEEARALGLSIGPFVGSTLSLPPAPETEDHDQWEAYVDETTEYLAARTQIADDDCGPVNLLCRSGARGNVRQLRQLVGPDRAAIDTDGKSLPIRHGWREGMSRGEFWAQLVRARSELAEVVLEMHELENDGAAGTPSGYGLLERARRSKCPGVVFARAAASGATCHLADPYSRHFVGLPVNDPSE